MNTNLQNPISPVWVYYNMPRQAMGGLEKMVESLINITKVAMKGEMELKTYFSHYYFAVYEFKNEVTHNYPVFLSDLPQIQAEMSQDFEVWEKDASLTQFIPKIDYALKLTNQICEPIIGKKWQEAMDIDNPLANEWLEITLLLEFPLLALLIIQYEEIEISDKRIVEFTEMTEKAAYRFGEISAILGLIPHYSPKLSLSMLRELSKIKRITPAEQTAFREKHSIKKEAGEKLQALWKDAPQIEELLKMVSK